MSWVQSGRRVSGKDIELRPQTNWCANSLMPSLNQYRAMRSKANTESIAGFQVCAISPE